MPATRKAQKDAEMRRISQIGDFKKRLGGVMELPSGLIVKVRNPGGLRAFMGSGVIPNSLMTYIERGLSTGKGITSKDLAPDGKLDPKLIDDMTMLLDGITLKTVVEPRIHPLLTDADLVKWNTEHPDDQLEDVEQLRRDDRLYIDEIPDDDKQFLFQWISGGTRDLETFRQRLEQNVDSLAAVTGNGDSAKSDDGVNAG